MKNQFIIAIVLCLLACHPASAQQIQNSMLGKNLNQGLFIPSKELKRSQLKKAFTAPVLLTLAGLYSITDNEWLSKYEVKEERDEWTPTFRHHADDYLQYAPIAVTYGLTMLGVKGKNNFGNRTAILIKSELMVAALTFSIKRITAVPRPDTGQPTSFPSGHTAQAFAAATFMSKEYGHKSIWYSIGAYTVATGVGTMRMLNNRHWVSDVLVGAGVGILSTNIAYLTHQYKWGKRKNNHSTIILPSYDGKTGMVSVVRTL